MAGELIRVHLVFRDALFVRKLLTNARLKISASVDALGQCCFPGRIHFASAAPLA
jgi:hypothetical protein